MGDEIDVEDLLQIEEETLDKKEILEIQETQDQGETLEKVITCQLKSRAVI